MLSIFALIVGVTLFVYSGYLRHDCERTHLILGTKSVLDERSMFFLMPGLAFIFLGIGLVQFAVLCRGIAESVALTICVLLSAFGFVLLVVALLKIPFPKWSIPAWAREVIAERDAGTFKAKPTKPQRTRAERERALREAEQEEKREKRRERKANGKQKRNRKHHR
ncbi:MAG: hypothetical protein E7A62_07375 [Actinomycetaceae bacterium]|nr:hypothetical protein [Actinomycetaceae bacterium]MDU0970799.1 hypothetical protein [Actinomycetaceae bacterium]